MRKKLGNNIQCEKLENRFVSNEDYHRFKDIVDLLQVVAGQTKSPKRSKNKILNSLDKIYLEVGREPERVICRKIYEVLSVCEAIKSALSPLLFNLFSSSRTIFLRFESVSEEKALKIFKEKHLWNRLEYSFQRYFYSENKNIEYTNKTNWYGYIKNISSVTIGPQFTIIRFSTSKDEIAELVLKNKLPVKV